MDDNYSGNNGNESDEVNSNVEQTGTFAENTGAAPENTDSGVQSAVSASDGTSRSAADLPKDRAEDTSQETVKTQGVYNSPYGEQVTWQGVYPQENQQPQSGTYGVYRQPGVYNPYNQEAVSISRSGAYQQPYQGGIPEPRVYQQYGYKPPKKRFSSGLKAFIWIFSILLFGSLIGFGGYIGYNIINNGWNPSLPNNNYHLPNLPFGEDSSSESSGGDDDALIPPESGSESSSESSETSVDVEVTPNTEGIMINPLPAGEELDAKSVYQKAVASTVTVQATITTVDGEQDTGTGTGIIATSDGYIITNSHVVRNSKSTAVVVVTNDGQEYDAVVVGLDRTTDLAVIKTNDYGFTPAEFGDSEGLSIGEWVIAIGNPGGASFSSSLTRGVVSGLHRTVGAYSENGMTFIQTDAAINPGNSGGPLLNMHGQVVGINSSKIVSEGYEGMGFAIPVTDAREIINELLSGGYVPGRVRMGVVGVDVSQQQAMFSDLPLGFMISSIDEDGSFAGTEAAVGDIIVAINDTEVDGIDAISNELLKYKAGDTVTIKLYRPSKQVYTQGEELEVEIVLLEDKGETQR